MQGADRGARHRGGWPDADAVSLGLTGLIDQQWQGILFEGDEFDREAAKRQCRAYLCSVFPWLAERIEAGAPARRRKRARRSSKSPPTRRCATRCRRGSITTRSFTSSRRSTLFRPSWQIVCHVSELAKTGDYVAFEFFGQRGFVIRDDDRHAARVPQRLLASGARRRRRRAWAVREVPHAAAITAGPITSTAAIAASARPTPFRNSIARSSA